MSNNEFFLPIRELGKISDDIYLIINEIFIDYEVASDIVGKTLLSSYKGSFSLIEGEPIPFVFHKTKEIVNGNSKDTYSLKRVVSNDDMRISSSQGQSLRYLKSEIWPYKKQLEEKQKALSLDKDALALFHHKSVNTKEYSMARSHPLVALTLNEQTAQEKFFTSLFYPDGDSNLCNKKDESKVCKTVPLDRFDNGVTYGSTRKCTICETVTMSVNFHIKIPEASHEARRIIIHTNNDEIPDIPLRCHREQDAYNTIWLSIYNRASISQNHSWNLVEKHLNGKDLMCSNCSLELYMVYESDSDNEDE